MSFKRDLLTLLKPYYIINIILSLSYIIAKQIKIVCPFIFGEVECDFDSRETEILFFLMIVVMFRTRKSGSTSMLSYLSASFPYTKIANTILWFYADLVYGIIYATVAILAALLFPELTASGPENITYFRGATGLDDELARDKNTTWLVTFYTVWNPNCINFANTFARLSHDYALINLKFGKVDIGRFPEIAKKYAISDSPLSAQLPTVILFKSGKEVSRRPFFDKKGKIQKFIFSEDNVKSAFDLNNLYKTCSQEKKNKKAIKQE